MNLIDRIRDRVKNMLLRAVVDAIDDSTKAQLLRVRVFRGEVSSDVESFAGMPGVTFVPVVGAEAILGSIGGNRSHPVVLAVLDRRTRPPDECAAGDVLLYQSADVAAKVHVKAGGVVEITGDVTISGNLTVAGDIAAAGDSSDGHASMAADRLIFDAHKHKENGQGGGVTDPPFTGQS